MPCCDVINRGAALYGNLVIFGTLDAQLVALDTVSYTHLTLPTSDLV